MVEVLVNKCVVVSANKNSRTNHLKEGEGERRMRRGTGRVTGEWNKERER
jgi:hypothetical protein